MHILTIPFLYRDQIGEDMFNGLAWGVVGAAILILFAEICIAVKEQIELIQ